MSQAPNIDQAARMLDFLGEDLARKFFEGLPSAVVLRVAKLLAAFARACGDSPFLHTSATIGTAGSDRNLTYSRGHGTCHIKMMGTGNAWSAKHTANPATASKAQADEFNTLSEAELASRSEGEVSDNLRPALARVIAEKIDEILRAAN